MTSVLTVIDCLTRGLNVEIIGRPGSGLSALIDATSEQLQDDGLRIVRVRGIGALRDRPLAAVVASVPSLGRQPSIADAVSLLSTELAVGGVLLVDDADDLDEVSAGVVAAFHVSTRRPVVVGRRAGGRPPDHVRRLLADLQPSVRHVMRPLTYDATRELVEAELGGPVDATTVARLATMSGGLPGIARTIAESARRVGLLMRTDGVWTAPGSLWSPELGPAVDALLVDATDADVDALALLAVAGPFTADGARAVLPGEQLDRLGELGLIDLVDGPGGGAVGIYPPLMGEHLREECSSARRAAIRERFIQHGHALPPSLAQGNDPHVDDAIVSHALADHEFARARGLLEQWRAEPTSTNAAPLMETLFDTHAFVADATQVHQLTDTSTCPDETVVEAQAWFAMHRWLTDGDRDAAERSLTDIIQRYPGASDFPRAALAHLRALVDGVAPEQIADLRGVTHPAPVSVAVQLKLARGLTAEAVAEADAAQTSHEFVGSLFEVYRALGRVLDGRFDEGRSQAAAHMAEARRCRRTGPFRAHAYTVALASAIQGRMAEVERIGSLVPMLTSGARLHAQYRTGVVGLADARRRWLSDQRGQIPADADATDLTGPFPFMIVDQGREDVPTGEALWRHAENAVGRGYLAAGTFALVEAVELTPDARRLARVTAALGGQQGSFLRDLVRLAEAVVARDVDALRALEESFAAGGAWLYSARAGLSQAFALRATGDNAGAAAHAACVWDRVVPVTDGLEGLFTRFAQSLDLTPRELEIAAYAIDRRTTVDIAKDLVLSVRTVEHHLFNTYRKIGIDSREALRAASETWLRAPLREPARPPETTGAAPRR